MAFGKELQEQLGILGRHAAVPREGHFQDTNAGDLVHKPRDDWSIWSTVATCGNFLQILDLFDPF